MCIFNRRKKWVALVAVEINLIQVDLEDLLLENQAQVKLLELLITKKVELQG